MDWEHTCKCWHALYTQVYTYINKSNNMQDSDSGNYMGCVPGGKRKKQSMQDAS